MYVCNELKQSDTMMRSLILATILCLVHGQTKFCCYPTQWEGQEGSTTGSADDEGHTAVTTVCKAIENTYI